MAAMGPDEALVQSTISASAWLCQEMTCGQWTDFCCALQRLLDIVHF